MDSNCRKLGETPYRECRKQAAIYNDALGSMERAAEMLGVSVNTLSNYELGVTVPPVDIIIVMADLYRAPQLKRCIVRRTVEVGYIQLPQWSDPEYVRHHDQCFIQLAESHFGRLGSQ